MLYKRRLIIMKKERIVLTEYGRGHEIENGRKRNEPKQRQDREGRRGDTHLRAWDRVYTGVEVSSFGFVEIAALRERGISRTRALPRVATHNDTDAFVIHVTIVHDVGYTK